MASKRSSVQMVEQWVCIPLCTSFQCRLNVTCKNAEQMLWAAGAAQKQQGVKRWNPAALHCWTSKDELPVMVIRYLKHKRQLSCLPFVTTGLKPSPAAQFIIQSGPDLLAAPFLCLSLKFRAPHVTESPPCFPTSSCSSDGAVGWSC